MGLGSWLSRDEKGTHLCDDVAEELDQALSELRPAGERVDQPCRAVLGLPAETPADGEPPEKPCCSVLRATHTGSLQGSFP